MMGDGSIGRENRLLIRDNMKRIASDKKLVTMFIGRTLDLEQHNRQQQQQINSLRRELDALKRGVVST